MKKTAKRFLSLVLALTMLLSVATVFASAATANTVKQYKTYLQLGDSISAGFGLKDYNRRVDAKHGKLLINNGGVLSCQTRIKGSYADLLANDVQATKMYPYATPGLRSSEIRYLIDPSFSADWVTRSPAIEELSMGGYDYKKITSWRPYYNKAVKAADLITLDFGMNDTWFAVVAAVLEITYGIGGSDVSEVLENAFDLYGSMEAIMDATGLGLSKILQVPGLVNLLIDGVRKFWIDFYNNYAAIVDYIYRVNPDVTVVSIGCYNSFKDWELPIYLIPQIACYVPMNGMKAALADKYPNYYYADVKDTEVIGQHLTLPLPNNISLDASGYNPHPTAAGHKYIENQVLAVLPTGPRSANFKASSYPEVTKENGVWAVRNNGKINRSYTGLGESENGIYYVKDGVVDLKTNGIVNLNGTKYYVKNSKFQDEYTGVVKTAKATYYVKDGIAQMNYTGLIADNGTKYYIKNGTVQTDYTGVVKASSSTSYYVKNGVVDTSYNGSVSTSKYVYTVENGVVTNTRAK